MSLRQSVTYACRSLLRAPLFSAAVVATLTIGIGAAAAIFAVVNAVLLQPLPYANPERLVGAWHDMPALSLTHAQQTSATYRTYRTFARTIEGIAASSSITTLRVSLTFPVANSEMLPKPTLWWLRPVRSAERVGEHNAVV